MVRDQIKEILAQNSMGPFLFVGSGFSRRYLGLESWEGLLRRFCTGIRQYYYSTANQKLPLVASLMAKDFHEYFWSAEEYEDLRNESLPYLRDDTSALRIDVSDYLRRTSDDMDVIHLVKLSKEDKEHEVFHWVDTIIGNLKKFIDGTYHGRETLKQMYIEEFVYRFNRRHFGNKLVGRLLSACAATPPITSTTS